VDVADFAELCTRAPKVGPEAFAAEWIESAAWAIGPGGGAHVDLLGTVESVPPLYRLSVKLLTLAAHQLRDLGRLAMLDDTKFAGLAPIGRASVEACSTVAWLLDDSVTAEIRNQRAWLVWIVSEGEAEVTARKDAGRTGAMIGSPARLQEHQAALFAELGLSISAKSERTSPRDWRLGDVSLPGRGDLVDAAVKRWFPDSDGRTFYSQISRGSHSNVLVALAVVNDKLEMTQMGNEIVFTAAHMWGRAWHHLLTYLNLGSKPFDLWLSELQAATWNA